MLDNANTNINIITQNYERRGWFSFFTLSRAYIVSIYAICVYSLHFFN